MGVISGAHRGVLIVRIAIAADHAGFDMKKHVKERLQTWGHSVEDYGVHDTRSADYADFGRPAAQAVAYGKADRGILIDGAGVAMSIVANRIPFVRAVVCNEAYMAEMARSHNDANVLCLGGRMIGVQMVDRILETFLNTEFEGGRHERRIAKIEE
ncbi:MAG: ribose 5-phosphate isomerase B [Acidobacteria bacterium]|nr:ribose 5-phosphate isomerase B [Acidobacteriota bacterium]